MRFRCRARKIFKLPSAGGQSSACIRSSDGRMRSITRFPKRLRAAIGARGPCSKLKSHLSTQGSGAGKRSRVYDKPETMPRHDVVKNQRTGRTYVSASWRDGKMAPPFVTLGADDARSREGQYAMLYAKNNWVACVTIHRSPRGGHVDNLRCSLLSVGSDTPNYRASSGVASRAERSDGQGLHGQKCQTFIKFKGRIAQSAKTQKPRVGWPKM